MYFILVISFILFLLTSFIVHLIRKKRINKLIESKRYDKALKMLQRYDTVFGVTFWTRYRYEKTLADLFYSDRLTEFPKEAVLSVYPRIETAASADARIQTAIFVVLTNCDKQIVMRSLSAKHIREKRPAETAFFLALFSSDFDELKAILNRREFESPKTAEYFERIASSVASPDPGNEVKEA